ncbi:MAG: FAD-dependent oxidoreductase [Lentisphaerae bacterium]|nr:FAD-dependent oxidoreductase [Lentisphaerota bacterium]
MSKGNCRRSNKPRRHSNFDFPISAVLNSQFSIQNSKFIILVWVVSVCLFWNSAGMAREAIWSRQKETVESSHDVIVVGAGWAGLTAALCLSDNDVKVLEAGDRLGGNVIAGNYRGVPYDHGVGRIGSLDGAMWDVLRALRIKPVEIPAPLEVVYRDGRYYYGGEGRARLLIAESSEKIFNRFLQIVRGYAIRYENIPGLDWNPAWAELDAMTAGQWFDSMKLPPVYRELFTVTARRRFGAGLDEISALCLIPAIASEFGGFEPAPPAKPEAGGPITGKTPSAKKVSSSEKKSASDKTKAEEKTNAEEQAEAEKAKAEKRLADAGKAYTCRGGLAEITDALAARLGDRVRLQATVVGVSTSASGYRVDYDDGAGRRHRLAAKAVILAVPPSVALEVAAEALDAEQKDILRQIPYSTQITATLFSKAPLFDKAFELVVPDDFFFAELRDSLWVRRHLARETGPADARIFNVRIPPRRFDDRRLLAMSDEQLLANVLRDMETILPGTRQSVIEHEFRRFPSAQPVMTPGAYERLMRLHRLTGGGLLLAGDYTIYPSLEAAVASGAIAARKAAQHLKISARDGGSLGTFGRGKMQKPFEDAAFGLRIGEMSGIVDTESGVHVILRTG